MPSKMNHLIGTNYKQYNNYNIDTWLSDNLSAMLTLWEQFVQI